jgi:predicted O-methyltransferase YrrM
VIWRQIAQEAAGWLADEEGEALRRHALSAPDGPLAEIGGYAGKSACWIGSAAQERGTIMFSIDWHRGSPEMAPGEDCHQPEMVGPDGFDTLPHFRRNIHNAGLEGVVIPVVGSSHVVGRHWHTPLAFLFIDGAHDDQGVLTDYELWAPLVLPGGILAFHDATIPGIASTVDRAAHDNFEHIEQAGCLQILRRVR